MRTWDRAVVALLCVGCGATVRRGDPVQEIRMTGLKRTMRRCANCASEPAPDLPPLPERVLDGSVRERVPLPAANRMLDFKDRQSGR